MIQQTNQPWSEDKLDDMLSQPASDLIADIKKIEGDIVVIGGGGKMGPSLCVLAKRAVEAAGVTKKIIAVDLFPDEMSRPYLEKNGVECVKVDLLYAKQVAGLPDAPNVLYMAGRKFGTQGAEHMTWAMNTIIPMHIAQRYNKSKVVVFSSGNIYPLTPVYLGGATESTPVNPVGEYAMSCLGRERVFDFFAREKGLKCCFYRLNYAVALRYGVLYDIANTILSGESVSLAPTAFNCIWQGDANAIAIRALLHCGTPPKIFNVTGPETVSMQNTAKRIAAMLNKEISLIGEEQLTALLSNAGKAMATFGYPKVSMDTLINWQVEWLKSGGSSLGKPTHFEQREGKF